MDMWAKVTVFLRNFVQEHVPLLPDDDVAVAEDNTTTQPKPSVTVLEKANMGRQKQRSLRKGREMKSEACAHAAKPDTSHQNQRRRTAQNFVRTTTTHVKVFGRFIDP